MSRIYDIVLPKFMVLNKEKIARAAVIIGVIALLLIAIRPHPSPTRYDYENDLLSYLQEREGATDVRIFGDSEVDALDWYGNYTMITPGSILFIVLNDGEPFYLDRNSEYYLDIFEKAGVNYIYDSPHRQAIDQIFIEINEDEDHFNLVYDKNGLRLWEVKTWTPH